MAKEKSEKEKQEDNDAIALAVLATSIGLIVAPWFTVPFVLKKTGQYLGEKAAEKWFGDSE